MVSRNAPPAADHQPKLSQPGAKEVRLAVISQDDSVGTAVCSCGWLVRAARKKVRENTAQRHLDKKHGGQGLWM